MFVLITYTNLKWSEPPPFSLARPGRKYQLQISQFIPSYDNNPLTLIYLDLSSVQLLATRPFLTYTSPDSANPVRISTETKTTTSLTYTQIISSLISWLPESPHLIPSRSSHVQLLSQIFPFLPVDFSPIPQPVPSPTIQCANLANPIPRKS